MKPDLSVPALKSWLDAGLNFFYPPVCQVCGSARATPDEGYVCGSCWSRDGGVRFIKAPFCERCGLPFDGDITTPFECANCKEMDLHFSAARSAVIARGLVRDVIHRYKYQQALWFESFLADLLIRQAKPELARQTWDLLVPIPLHPAKQRERGFNQAGRLADRLGEATGLPVAHRALRRVIPTHTQTQLSRQERAANMRKAFAAGRSESLKDARVVIVDDVFTTGATTSACAKVLLSAGAAGVCVWTVARADYK